MKDCFVPFKLLFFKEIPKKLNEFLVVFQANKPMAPFLTETLEDLSKTFMRKFIPLWQVRAVSRDFLGTPFFEMVFFLTNTMFAYG